ncbi:MAG: HAMP domain-containing sensor histidine kinase [Edaphocola sp.]
MAGLLGLLFFYKRIRNKNALLALQNTQISHQKEELQKLNGVKDRLFSIISHDLRSPIHTLTAYHSLADDAHLPEEKRQKYKQQTRQALGQTADLLDNLLAWANMQLKNSGVHLSTCSISDSVTEVLDALAPQARLKQVTFKKNLLVDEFISDKTILPTSLRNMLTNSVKFSNPEGTIYIRSQIVENNLYLSVQDEGIGMTPEQIVDFNASEMDSSKGAAGEKGSGLGLYLVQELLAKLKGRLLLQSEQGKGSTFTLVLPLAQI